MLDMENVTLNQREQAKLQVLNSLLAKHMTIEQASVLMGVSIRHSVAHTGGISERQEQPQSLTDIGVAGRPTRYRRRRMPTCCTWRARGTLEPTTPI